MTLIIGVLAALGVAVTLASLRVPGGVNAAKLGAVSEQWLAEHRATHPS